MQDRKFVPELWATESRREEMEKLTQAQLAEQLGISAQAVNGSQEFPAGYYDACSIITGVGSEYR